MANFLFGFHSGWRYVVLLAGLIALVLSLAGFREGRLSAGALRVIRLYTTALDLQLLAGVGLLVVRPFFPALIGHLVLMVATVAVAHLLSVTLKRRPPERRTPALAATGVGITLLLIVGGILAIGRPLV